MQKCPKPFTGAFITVLAVAFFFSPVVHAGEGAATPQAILGR